MHNWYFKREAPLKTKGKNLPKSLPWICNHPTLQRQDRKLSVLFCIILLSVSKVSYPWHISSNLFILGETELTFFHLYFFCGFYIPVFVYSFGEGFDLFLLLWKSSILRTFIFCLSDMFGVLFPKWTVDFFQFFIPFLCFLFASSISNSIHRHIHPSFSGRRKCSMEKGWKAGWELNTGLSDLGTTGDLDKGTFTRVRPPNGLAVTSALFWLLFLCNQPHPLWTGVGSRQHRHRFWFFF